MTAHLLCLHKANMVASSFSNLNWREPIYCSITTTRNLEPHSPTHTVDSNDSLYAGDKKFVAEVAKLVHTLLEQILEHMKSLTTSDEVRGTALLLWLGWLVMDHWLDDCLWGTCLLGVLPCSCGDDRLYWALDCLQGMWTHYHHSIHVVAGVFCSW